MLKEKGHLILPRKGEGNWEGQMREESGLGGRLPPM